MLSDVDSAQRLEDMMNTNTITLNDTIIQLVNGGELALTDLPPRALALDGAVQGPAHDDEDRWSVDHHAGCLRLATDATCRQVWRMVLFGLDIDDREIYINDIDGDTLLSLWCLLHPDKAHNSTVRSLVRGVGAVDAHGPSGYLELAEHEADMTRTFFSPKGVYGVVPRDVQQRFEEWPTIIEAGLALIDKIVAGDLVAEPAPEPEIESLDSSFGRINLRLVQADGFGAFEPSYRLGYDVVIVTNGKGTFTIGKKSDLVNYPLGPAEKPNTLLGKLKALEPGWGGGSSIGGSPRPNGSKLAIDQIWYLAVKLA